MNRSLKRKRSLVPDAKLQKMLTLYTFITGEKNAERERKRL